MIYYGFPAFLWEPVFSDTDYFCLYEPYALFKISMSMMEKERCSCVLKKKSHYLQVLVAHWVCIVN